MTTRTQEIYQTEGLDWQTRIARALDRAAAPTVDVPFGETAAPFTANDRACAGDFQTCAVHEALVHTFTRHGLAVDVDSEGDLTTHRDADCSHLYALGLDFSGTVDAQDPPAAAVLLEQIWTEAARIAQARAKAAPPPAPQGRPVATVSVLTHSAASQTPSLHSLASDRIES